MGLGDWLKTKVATVMIGLSSMEKNILGQDGGHDLGALNQVQRHRQGTLADDLMQGKITQEVKDLRWRMYKVVDESQQWKTKVVGYDEDGMPITDTVKIDFDEEGGFVLSKVKVDPEDDYPLELMVNNDEVTIGGLGGLDDIDIVTLKQEDINNSKEEDDEGNWSASIGTIGGEAYESASKAERVIDCIREGRCKFEMEKFTKKMNVRTISETEKLLEFYVSIYPDEFNRKSRFFISEIKKAIKNPRMCDFLDIVGVKFVSYNTVGVKDLHEFEYKIIKFDKIVQYDGYYIIKFKAEVVKNGISLYEQYREDGLDERYENKEAK